MSAVMPLVARYPEIARIPRAALGVRRTPVTRLATLGVHLWIKRDDLSADPMGGNKVRALEFLLGPVARGDRVATVGSAGSTHALAVCRYAKQLGARTVVGRWRQEMNDAARIVARRIADEAEAAPIFGSPVGAYAWTALARLRGARWIAAGGSTPLGILGHVNAGLELIEQIDAGELESPSRVVVPLGTGGTAAGLALAFAIAGRPIVVVGARVVPRVIARRQHVIRLANATARLIEGLGGSRLPRVTRAAVSVAHEVYGGAYGRETPAGRDATTRLREAAGVGLDATYSAKALAQALPLSKDAPTLFWLTFDPRSLDAHDRSA